MNYLLFSTSGDWDSTKLFINGNEFLASQLMIQLHAGRDYDGQPARGGITRGGEASAYVVPQSDEDQQIAIFPGKIDMEFPTHKVTIENTSPMFAIEFTQVILDNQNVTQNVVDLEVTIDAINNQVSAFLVVFKPHFLGADEVATYTLL